MVRNANKWNTFTMSEYNDIDTKPNDFPIGIGKGNLGLFFDRSVSIKQTMVKIICLFTFNQEKNYYIVDIAFYGRMIIKKDKYKILKHLR